MCSFNQSYSYLFVSDVSVGVNGRYFNTAKGFDILSKKVDNMKFLIIDLPSFTVTASLKPDRINLQIVWTNLIEVNFELTNDNIFQNVMKQFLISMITKTLKGLDFSKISESEI